MHRRCCADGSLEGGEGLDAVVCVGHKSLSRANGWCPFPSVPTFTRHTPHYAHHTRGVFINVNSLPPGAQWLPYISFIKWAFNALAANQFRGMTFACEEDGAKVRSEDFLGVCACDCVFRGGSAVVCVCVCARATRLLSNSNQTHPPLRSRRSRLQGCVSTGEQVLHLYAMDQYSIGQCALAMLGITVAFTAMGYVVLKCVGLSWCLNRWMDG